MSNFFDELKRRNVIKAAIAYAVIAWVVLQVLSIILPNIQAPEWVMKTFTVLAIIGFPVWVLISWVYEVTPDGLKKTNQVEADQSITAATNKRLNILILVGLVIAIAVSFINRPTSSSTNEADLVLLNNSIAVLPFDDMSSEGDTQWFCDGMTEDILTNLSRIKELKVISRTSTERYRETDKSIPEIAAELGVSYVVEGSVRKFEDQVIITAQLIDANDQHLWAQNYDDNFKEVFKIQQDVSQKIVNQLKIAISPEEEKAIYKLPTTNLEAYNLVLKGRSFYEKSSIEDLKIGVDLLEQATKLDDQYAEAFAELAYANLLSIFVNDRVHRLKFLNAAKKSNEIALKLDPNSVRALSNKGLIMTESSDRETRLQAEPYFKKALELNPNDAVSHLEIAIFYNQQLNNDSLGLYHAQRSYELNPFSVDAIWNLADAMIDNERVEEARKLFNENKHLLPNNDATSNFTSFLTDSEAKSLLKKGEHYSKAIEVYEANIQNEPNTGSAYHFLGAFYDNYMNDDINAIKYMKLALEADSTNGSRYFNYNNMLCEAKQFDKARDFMATNGFQKRTNAYQKGLSSFVYYYHQEKYDEVKEIVKDTVLANNDHYKILLYSQLGDKQKVYELLNNDGIATEDKAFAFGILKERDSMYRYLNMENINAGWINSRREFDPYRKEPPFIAFMKKNHLPLLEKYNGVTE